MKAKNLIFLLLLAVAGIKAKACDTCDVDRHITFRSEAGEQIQVRTTPTACSAGSLKELVLALDCKRGRATGEITCRVPNQFVNTLKSGSIISQVVANQDTSTFLSLVLKSSKKGAIIGAIVGSIVGTYLLGKSLYKILRYSDQGRRGEVAYFLKQHLETDLSVTLRLPKLLIGLKYTTYPLSICCEWLINHSLLPEQFRDSVFFMLSGIIEWGLSGALVGAIAGPVFLAMNPHQAVSVVLKVAHDQSTKQ